MEIKITYNGKSYKSITDALHKGIVDGIKESIFKTLKPFESEILSCGGKVEIKIDKNFESVKIDMEGMSDDLMDRITKTLEE